MFGEALKKIFTVVKKGKVLMNDQQYRNFCTVGNPEDGQNCSHADIDSCSDENNGSDYAFTVGRKPCGFGVLSSAPAIFLAIFVISMNVSAFEMKAGVAKAVITPPLDTPLVMVNGERFNGVAHDLYSRALVLNDGSKRMVILANDLNCLDVATSILRQRCRDELGIDAAYFITLATHNHNAPIQIVPDNFAYGRWLAERMFALIQEAIAHEQGPVTLRFGFGHGYFLKSMGNAPTDFEIQVLEVLQGDAPMALLFNHPTHPLQADEKKIDVGHPGYAVEELERRLAGVMAMYGDACGGNQFTAMGMEGTLELEQALGKRLADSVMEIVRGDMQEVTGAIESRLEVISLPLADPMPFEEAKKLAGHFPQSIGFVPYPHPDRPSNWIRNLMKHYKEKIPFPKRTTDRVCTDDGFLVQSYDTPREFPCRYEETIVAKVGPMVFVAMQGEVCAPIGMRIKDAYRQEMPIMVFGYMGEHNLYIPTRELVRLGYYQAQVIQIQYASPAGWAPSVEDDMVTGVKGLISRVINENF